MPPEWRWEQAPLGLDWQRIGPPPDLRVRGFIRPRTMPTPFALSPYGVLHICQDGNPEVMLCGAEFGDYWDTLHSGPRITPTTEDACQQCLEAQLMQESDREEG